MPVGTSNGEYYETDFDHEHAMMFGGRPGVYNPKTDTWEAAPAEDEKKDNKLFLVRHGDTQLNDEDRVHGWTTQPLNEKGVQQSQKAAESLSNKNITNIVSSDLPRAKQTANIISRETGAPIIINPNLRTWDTGYLDGSDAKEAHDLVKKHPVDNPDTPLPGGSESFNEFKDRVISAVSDVRKNADGNTVIVSHSKPIGVIDGWEKNGFSKDGSVHMDTYEDSRCRPTTGGHQELNLPQQAAEVAAKRMKGAVLHGADQPSDIALGHGMQRVGEFLTSGDLEPKHLPGTEPKDYLRELLQNPDIMEKSIEQASNFNFVGMFGGAKGSLAFFGDKVSKEYIKATRMARQGADPKDIFKETGWYQDVDKHWKEVIPTDKAELNKSGWDKTLNTDEYKLKNGGWGFKLPDIYNNPDFYARYPEAKDIKVGVESRVDASYEPVPGRPGAPGILRISNFKSEKDLLNFIHHELQHYIQDYEGFPSGGSTRDFKVPAKLLDLQRILGDHRDQLEQLIADRAGVPRFTDKGLSAYGLTAFALRSLDSIKSGKISNFENSLLKDKTSEVYRFFKDNPDIVDAVERHKWYKEEIAKERNTFDPQKLYESIYGEVEARNAEKWAGMSPEMKAMYQSQGMSPRDTAAKDVPEDKRIFAPSGKQSFSESDLSGSVNRMRSEGRTWREISKELDIPLNKLYRTFRDDANYTTGKRYVPPTEGAPMKWTKEYGYPGSSKWQKAFGRLENKNTPRNKSLDTMTDEEKLKYIMQSK